MGKSKIGQVICGCFFKKYFWFSVACLLSIQEKKNTSGVKMAISETYKKGGRGYLVDPCTFQLLSPRAFFLPPHPFTSPPSPNKKPIALSRAGASGCRLCGRREVVAQPTELIGASSAVPPPAARGLLIGPEPRHSGHQKGLGGGGGRREGRGQMTSRHQEARLWFLRC